MDDLPWAAPVETEAEIKRIDERLAEHRCELDDLAGQRPALIQAEQKIEALWRTVLQIQQQRGVAEVQMERATRSAALDLAIKATGTERQAVDPATLTATADAFLAWLRAA